MQKLDLSKYSSAIVGDNTEMYCDELIVTGHFTLGDNVVIKAKKIVLGNNAKIESNVSIRALRNEMELFQMGDESLIGFNSQLMVPEYRMGDYSQVFNGALISGYKPVTMGHNCWVGQGAILNSADTLTMGNNVRMGGSQVWTHVASGELLEGSNFHNTAPVVIEDNVWLMGFGHTITPGITLACNTVVMAGSVVTKSTEPYKTYSGIPAKDVSDKLPAWKEMGDVAKFEMLQIFVGEFVEQYPEYNDRVFCIDMNATDGNEMIVEKMQMQQQALFFLNNADLKEYIDSKHSFFDLSSKQYTKRHSDIEVHWMKFAIGYRARFIPFNEVRS